MNNRKILSILRSRVLIGRHGHSWSVPLYGRYISSSPKHARIERIFNRLPKFIQPYAAGLRKAPISHIVSFLILHELTAIIPLVGLSLGFHYSGWLPDFWNEGRWIDEGIGKFGNYFSRKGWFGIQKISEETDGNNWLGTQSSTANIMTAPKRVERKWETGLTGRTVLIQVATAYAITKVLLPVRILFSVWCTPWFASAILGNLKRFLSKG